MLVERRSPFSGKITTMDIPITQEQLDNWHNGMMIQEAMPNVPAGMREFLMTGITPAEWDEMFLSQQEDEKFCVGNSIEEDDDRASQEESS
jgi:hypothetical protein